MKRKIISLFIAFVIISSQMFCSVSADNTETAGYGDDIKFLNALGINIVDQSSINEPVTRRTATLMALSLHGLNYSVPGYNNEFTDVTGDDTEAGKLLYAVKNGLIARTNDGRFLPDGNLKYIDALKFVFNAINYYHVVKGVGKGDSEYYNLAKKYDVSLSPDNNSALTVGEFAHLVVLALDAPLMRASSVNGDGDVQYSSSKDITALTEYYDVYKAEGVVSKNNYTSLYETDNLSAPGIVIEGKVINCPDNVDVQNLLARKVVVYYNADNNMLVYHRFIDDDTVIKLECEEIEKYDDNSYYISEGNKLKKYTCDRNASIIYNGVAVTSEDYNLFIEKSGLIPPNGYVELVKNNSKNYNCIKITNYETYVVSGVDISRQKIVDKYGNEFLDLEDTENLFVCGIDGESIGFDYIDGMNILSVARSLNNYVVKVVVTADAVEGVLTSFDNGKIQLEGENFDLSESCIEKIEAGVIKLPPLNEEVIVYMDARGLVAVCEPSPNTGWEYGYLTEKGLTKGLDRKFMVKMLVKDGTLGEFDVASRVKIDGASYKKDAIGAYNDLIDAKLNVPVKYRLNVNGEIKDIDTPVVGSKEDENSLKHVLDNEKIKWVDYVSAFDGNIFMKAGAICFVVPETPTSDERDYSVSTVEGSFVKDTSYNVSIYGENPEDIVNTVVVKKTNNSRQVSADKTIAVVDKVAHGLNSQGEEVWKIYAVNNGVMNAYTISDYDIYNHSTDPDPLERGDLVRFNANERREVIAMERSFDSRTRTISERINGEYGSDTSTPCLYPSNGNLNVMLHLAYGKTINFKNKIMQMQYNDAAGTIQNYYFMGRVIVVDKNEVRIGSINDLVFDPSGSISSDIFLEMRYLRVRTIVVYKNI